MNRVGISLLPPAPLVLGISITDVLGRYLMASSGDARELYCSALTQGGWRMVAPARITKLIKILDLAKKIRFLNSFVID